MGGTRLAILGGRPAFDEPRHVGAPNLPDAAAFERRIRSAFAHRRLTNDGPLVQEFESAVSARLGVRHCITTCNATTGLMVLARALELAGEVIMPSFTFAGTAHAMRWLGLKPVFCDVDRASHTLDPVAVVEAINEHTCAILGVHTWGRLCDTDALDEVAGHHGIELIFDAAPAFACGRNGVAVGNYGRAEVVSFHATKVLNTFEGGAILTNDDELAERIRPMITFGFVGEDSVIGLGINAKMSEAAAAMGLAQLERLPQTVAVNAAHHACYRSRLVELPGVTVLDIGGADESNFHYVVLEIEPETAPIDRDTLKRVLNAENVLARRYFYPGCHRLAPYATERTAEDLAVTAWLAARVLQLPTGTALDTDDVEKICTLVSRALDNSGSLYASLR